MASPKEVWESFFAACDLPVKVQKQYAVKFTLERIQPYMLKDLGKEELRSLGVTALGDQLAILHYIRDTNGNPSVFRQVSSNNVTSSSQSTSSTEPRTRLVRRGNAITVADEIPIRTQSRVIQKRSQPKAPIQAKLRSEEMVLEERRQRFLSNQPSSSRVFVNQNFSADSRGPRHISHQNPSNGIHRRVNYSRHIQDSPPRRSEIRYVEQVSSRPRVKYQRR